MECTFFGAVHFNVSSPVIVQLLYNRKQFTAEISRPSLSLLGLVFIFAASTVCFIESLHYTQVASTLVIINTAPSLLLFQVSS